MGLKRHNYTQHVRPLLINFSTKNSPELSPSWPIAYPSPTSPPPSPSPSRTYTCASDRGRCRSIYILNTTSQPITKPQFLPLEGTEGGSTSRISMRVFFFCFIKFIDRVRPI